MTQKSPYPKKSMKLPIEFEFQIRKFVDLLAQINQDKVNLSDLTAKDFIKLLALEEVQSQWKKEILEDYWGDENFIKPRIIEIDSDDSDDVVNSVDSDDSVGSIDDIAVFVEIKESNNGNHRVDPRIKEILEDIEATDAIIDLTRIAEQIGITREDFLFFCGQHRNNGIFNKEAIKTSLKKEAERYFEEVKPELATTSRNL